MCASRFGATSKAPGKAVSGTARSGFCLFTFRFSWLSLRHNVNECTHGCTFQAFDTVYKVVDELDSLVIEMTAKKNSPSADCHGFLKLLTLFAGQFESYLQAVDELGARLLLVVLELVDEGPAHPHDARELRSP